MSWFQMNVVSNVWSQMNVVSIVCTPWRTCRPPWSTSPGPEQLDDSISLKILLETRLQSELFDTLDDLLGFQAQKL